MKDELSFTPLKVGLLYRSKFWAGLVPHAHSLNIVANPRTFLLDFFDFLLETV
jgi:hypothetical protein